MTKALLVVLDGLSRVAQGSVSDAKVAQVHALLLFDRRSHD